MNREKRKDIPYIRILVLSVEGKMETENQYLANVTVVIASKQGPPIDAKISGPTYDEK